jgi:hypothetical protein
MRNTALNRRIPSLLGCLLLLGSACARSTGPAALMTGSGVRKAALPGSGHSASAIGASERLAAPCAVAHARRIEVGDAAQLHEALSKAMPGDLIALSDGRYSGAFGTDHSGRPEAPITLCGSEAAVLVGASLEHGYVLHLRADHWLLSGFSVEHAQKGIVLDGASDNRLTDLRIRELGQEGVHLRAHSSRNTVDHCQIDATGLRDPEFGEGIYVGSAVTNWAQFTGSVFAPDRSDENRILRNTIGPNTAAENIDIKEGTRGGEIRENRLLGRNMRSGRHADAWVDLKGNAYLIVGNHGLDAPRDGFQVHVVLPGWGHDHVFTRNLADVNGPGHGFRIDSRASGVVLACDNIVRGAAQGFANVPCASRNGAVAPHSHTRRHPLDPR